MRLRLAVYLVVLISALFPVSAAAQQPPASIYWGAIVDGTQYGFGNTPADMRGVDQFEQNAGKKLSIISFGDGWQRGGKMLPFYPQLFDNIRTHGSIPLYTWQSYGDHWVDFSNAQVLSGRYDSYIHEWARAAGAWKHPFFLRFDHEMNGSWYPWGEGRAVPFGPIVNGNQPGSYARMWRHVHDIFSQEGAYNVTWVYAPNHECVCAGRYPPAAQTFPGVNYINWIGLSAYNRFPGQWLTFSQTILGGTQGIKDTYHPLVALAPNLPMMITEFGSIEGLPGQKAAWLKDALQTQIPSNFPAIHAVVYYDWSNGGLTIPIESSPQSQAAFNAGIQVSVYSSNTFANLGYARILK